MSEEDLMTDAELQEQNPVLGPDYFRARTAANRVVSEFEAEHFGEMKNLAHKLCDEFQDKLWSSITEYLLSDTEYNLQGEIQRRIENAVSALLSGEQWALNRYVLDGRYTGSVSAEKLRATVASHIPEELQSTRIAELEKEVQRLRSDLEWYRNR